MAGVTVNLMGTLGESNMETAAQEIVRRAVEAKTWLVLVSYDEMNAAGEACGFLLLLHYGWLCLPPIGTMGGKIRYGPSRKLVNRLRERQSWVPALEATIDDDYAAASAHFSKEVLPF